MIWNRFVAVNSVSNYVYYELAAGGPPQVSPAALAIAPVRIGWGRGHSQNLFPPAQQALTSRRAGLCWKWTVFVRYGFYNRYN
jgi:hypothetical protein